LGPGRANRIFKKSSTQIPLPAISGLVDTFGLVAMPTNGWGGPNPDLQFAYKGDTNEANLRSNLSTLDMLAQNLSAFRDQCSFIYYSGKPLLQGSLLFRQVWSRFDHRQLDREAFTDLSRANPLIHLYDAHKGGNHDYGNEDATDQDHLSEHGAQKFSARVDSLVNEILAK